MFWILFYSLSSWENLGWLLNHMLQWFPAFWTTTFLLGRRQKEAETGKERPMDALP